MNRMPNTNFSDELIAAGANPNMFPMFPSAPPPRPTQAERDLYNFGFADDGTGRLTVRPTAVEQEQQPALKRRNAPLSLPPAPNNQIGMGEALIRMGGAGLGGALDGGNFLTPMTEQYGAIEDANRSASIEAYNAAVKAKQKQEEADALAKYREAYLGIQQQKANNSATKAKAPDKDAQKTAAQIDQTLTKMQMALEAIDSGQELTGIFDGTLGAIIDRTAGNPEATSRLLLQELKVDAGLLMVAQTKGAISNAEMKLFLSPTPSMTDDEQVWRDWIARRMKAAMDIRNNLINGTTVNDPASPDMVNQFSSMGVGSPGTNSSFSEADAIVGLTQ